LRAWLKWSRKITGLKVRHEIGKKNYSITAKKGQCHRSFADKIPQNG
jgi:hypothetical protein